MLTLHSRVSLVLCFDVDGTLSSSNGPVQVEWLTKLEQNSPDTHVVIVSESGSRPKGFTEIISKDRLANLKNAREMFSGATLYIYVSDNGDNALSAEAGYVHVLPNDFRIPE